MCSQIRSFQDTQFQKNASKKQVFSKTDVPLIKKNLNLVNNDSFRRYEILRDRIVDKIFEVIFLLEDSQSSINKLLRNVMRKNNSDDKEKIQFSVLMINNNADYLLANDKADSFEFFKNLNNFVFSIKNLNKNLESYVLQSDSSDNFNVQDALDTLNRLINDFKILENSEEKFSKEFRQQYVKKFHEKDFF